MSTLRCLWIGAALGFVLIGASPDTFAQQQIGEWQLRPGRSGATAHLTIRESRFGNTGSYGRDVPVTSLRGFSLAMFAGSGPARFELVRDAGTLTFEGTFQFGSGSGTLTFEPDPDFAEELGRLGYGSLHQDELMSMVFLDVNLEFARGIRDTGLRASIKELIQLRIHSVTADFIRDIRSFGHNLTLQQFVQLKIHGVDSAYIKKLEDAGLKNLTAAQITQLKIHGVD